MRNVLRQPHPARAGETERSSQSNGETVSHIVNGPGDCADFPRAPQGQCKHKIARGIYMRAIALAKQRLSQLDHASTGQTTPASQPEPPTDEAQVWRSNTTP